MSYDKKYSILQAIISGLKYFIIAIAFIGPALTIGNVIADEKNTREKVSETIFSLVESDSELHQDWITDGEIIFPEKYISESDNVSDYIGNNHRNDDLNLVLIITGICILGSFGILTIHVFSVLSENTRLYNRYLDLCDEMEDEHRPYITKAFTIKINKKTLDPKITIILPIAITIVGVISTTLIIHQYGSRISNDMSGIVRRYGLEYSEQAMDVVNNIPDTEIEINVSLHRNQIHIDSDNSIRSIISPSGTYFRGSKVINHRMIPHGMIVCVKLNMIKYYNIIFTQLLLLAVYFIYLALSVIDNLPVIRFLAKKNYIMKGR